MFSACLEQQFHLCERLEALADSLPSTIDTREASRLSTQLARTLRRCHRQEEQIIFPALMSQDEKMRTILNRLHHEHLEDDDQARDVSEAIDAFVSGSPKDGAEELGYMLRCLFTSLRRHLAFDRDYIQPLFARASEN